jgi:hypothetical protein
VIAEKWDEAVNRTDEGRFYFSVTKPPGSTTFLRLSNFTSDEVDHLFGYAVQNCAFAEALAQRTPSARPYRR